MQCHGPLGLGLTIFSSMLLYSKRHCAELRP